MNIFGLLIRKAPMGILLEHYEVIQQSADVMKKSLECYVGGENSLEFKSLRRRLNELETRADKIIRYLRNNLPRSIFMPVNKVLLLNYTSAQDNILDSAQDSLNWLSLRKVAVPDEFREDLTELVDEACGMVLLLGPALKKTVSLVHLEGLDWEGAREEFSRIRDKKNRIFKLKHELSMRIYNSELDFKDTYLLIQFIEKIFAMCSNCSKCAEIQRSMITR
jgi:uncharacterized protein